MLALLNHLVRLVFLKNKSIAFFKGRLLVFRSFSILFNQTLDKVVKLVLHNVWLEDLKLSLSSLNFVLSVEFVKVLFHLLFLRRRLFYQVHLRIVQLKFRDCHRRNVWYDLATFVMNRVTASLLLQEQFSLVFLRLWRGIDLLVVH